MASAAVARDASNTTKTLIASTGRITASSFRSICEPIDKPQTTPGVIDCAHFVVHQTRFQANGAHITLRQVGCNAGGSLGPRHPQASGRLEAFRQRRKFLA